MIDLFVVCYDVEGCEDVALFIEKECFQMVVWNVKKNAPPVRNYGNNEYGDDEEME